MPRSIQLKPLIDSAKRNLDRFRKEYEKSMRLKRSDNEISETYHRLIVNLHENMEDFKDYRQNQLNQDTLEVVDDELLEEVVSSIFQIEKYENIGERSERVRQIKNIFFWEALKDFEWQLEQLEEEVKHFKNDDSDTDSSSRYQ